MKNGRVDPTRLRNRVNNTSGTIRKVIIFTDLDGTLLDSFYSYHAADEAIRLIREEGVPLVICSSKTRAEIEHYRKRMGTAGPFISENGGAVFIPRGYFSPATEDSIPADANEDGILVIRLGAEYRELREALVYLRGQGFDVRGFGDMAVPEIARLTKLPENEAWLASRREFDEPFIFKGNPDEAGKITDIIRPLGLRLTRGSFFHILGQSDKGMAVKIVKGLYQREFGALLTVALGDSPNDLPMLQAVDAPIIVQKPDGSYDPVLEGQGFLKAEGIGPRGWNSAVVDILDPLTFSDRGP